MASRPNALLKDLLSTGYFFEKLKNQPKSTEMDLPDYVRNFVVPYLITTTESHERSGQRNGSNIVNLAVKHLSEVGDDELADSIFGLKKVAISEMDIHEKALVQLERLGKSEFRACRQKLESAKSLAKLLVSVIKLFKLVEVITKRDGSNETRASIGDAISGDWELTLMQSA
jgi:hypothetical protein